MSVEPLDADERKQSLTVESERAGEFTALVEKRLSRLPAHGLPEA